MIASKFPINVQLIFPANMFCQKMLFPERLLGTNCLQRDFCVKLADYHVGEKGTLAV